MSSADGERQEQRQQQRQEIEELLPWHAAGTLSREDAQRVERALAEDPELARRYELVREELDATIEVNEALGAPSPRALDRLMTAIDAEPARTPRRDLRSGFARFIASLSPRAIAWAGTAAALVIVVQGGLIANLTLQSEPASYQTASGPEQPRITRSLEIGTYLMIRFNAQVPANEITQFLTTNKLTIVEGPVAGGMYRVRLAATPMSRDEIAAAIKRLQQDRRVEVVATAN